MNAIMPVLYNALPGFEQKWILKLFSEIKRHCDWRTICVHWLLPLSPDSHSFASVKVPPTQSLNYSYTHVLICIQQSFTHARCIILYTIRYIRTRCIYKIKQHKNVELKQTNVNYMLSSLEYNM